MCHECVPASPIVLTDIGSETHRFVDGQAQIDTVVKPFLSTFGLHIKHYAGEAAMLKIFMPYILKDVDDVIVLDADVVLVEDIAVLWQLLRDMPNQRAHRGWPLFLLVFGVCWCDVLLVCWCVWVFFCSSANDVQHH